MGVEAINYVIKDEIIDSYRKQEFDFERYADERDSSSFDKKYKFEDIVFIYEASTKCWSPMYNLLKILDTSENNILSEFKNDQKLIEDSAMNPRIRFFYSKEVKLIWNELKNISIGNIENSIDTPNIVERISNIEGYWNERIRHKEHVVSEFFELYKAFYDANSNNKGIIITYG